MKIHGNCRKGKIIGEGVKTNLIIAVDVLVESASAKQLELNNPLLFFLTVAARIQRQGEIWSSMCDWVQNFKTLNRHQLKGIKFHYRRNCKCSVSEKRE